MATIKEIAQALGVSPSTVSIVLNGNAEKRKIKKETVDKVLKAAEQMGYKPSLEARRLRAAQEGEQMEEDSVAVFWTLPLTETLLVRFLQGFNAWMTKHPDAKYIPNMFFYEPGNLEKHKNLFDGNHFHAAIVYSPRQADVDFLENCTFLGTKILTNVRHDVDIQRLERCHTVRLDVQNKNLVDIFHEAGTKSLGFCLSGPTLNFEEIGAYAKTIGMRAEFDGELEAGSIQGGYDWVMNRYAGTTAPYQYDGVICASERMGYGVLRGLRELGIRVPQDVKIMAVNVYNLNIEEFFTPRLSTIELPMENVAGESMNILESAKLDISTEIQHRIVESKLWIDGSLGASEGYRFIPKD